MNYLSDSEFETYGLESATPESFVAAATSMINMYCRRPSLAIMQFTERIRVMPGRNNALLTNLPLAILSGQTSPLISGRGRYAVPRRGEDTTMWELAEIALAYGLPGTWINLDVTNFDYFTETGEVSWLGNPLGLAFDEIELVYTAGFLQIPDPVKFACAQLVRNAQATPALNVRAGTVNSMHLEYFSDTLIDSSVQGMLAPYVAQKVG